MKTKSKIDGKIFLIEDNSAIIDVYTMAFQAAGFDFEVITFGRVAMERIKNIQNSKEEKPALILLDLMLPDVNGMEILKEIRQNDNTKDIVVFILSNYTDSEIKKPDSAVPDSIKPDKYIMKTSITPTKLVELILEQLK